MDLREEEIEKLTYDEIKKNIAEKNMTPGLSQKELYTKNFYHE